MQMAGVLNSTIFDDSFRSKLFYDSMIENEHFVCGHTALENSPYFYLLSREHKLME